MTRWSVVGRTECLCAYPVNFRLGDSYTAGKTATPARFHMRGALGQVAPSRVESETAINP